MNDLISRKAVIEQILKWEEDARNWANIYCTIGDFINEQRYMEYVEYCKNTIEFVNSIPSANNIEGET